MTARVPGPRRAPTWLVTGGAGYIGAHVVRTLRTRGLGTVTLDDLSTGRRSRIVGPAVVGRVQDRDLLARTFEAYRPAGVVHLAGSKSVEESVRDPGRYYDNNVSATLSLLETMRSAGVDRLVFSSSAAVYGRTGPAPVAETDPTEPLTPYGRSKLAAEWLVADHARAYGLRYAALRYFNVAGSAARELNETAGANLIPQVLAAISRGESPVIFGDGYRTADGSCVRDFVDVRDLAAAHASVLDLLTAPDAAHTFNVGTGRGFSVREVVDCALSATDSRLRPVVRAARAGDAPCVVADATRLRAHTGWRAEHDLPDMITTAIMHQCLRDHAQVSA